MKFVFCYNVHYDSKCNNLYLFHEHFIKGVVKFVLIDYNYGDKKEHDEYKKQQLQRIKECFGDDFREDMVITVNEDDRQRKLEEQDIREIANINIKIDKLDSISSGVIYKNCHLINLLKLYENNIITEKQMLYGFINVLCADNISKQNEVLKYYKFNLEVDEDCKCKS